MAEGGIFLDILARLNLASVERVLKDAKTAMAEGGRSSSRAFSESFQLDGAAAQFKELSFAADAAYRDMRVGLAELQRAEAQINSLRAQNFKRTSETMIAAQREVDAAIANTNKLIGDSRGANAAVMASRGGREPAPVVTPRGGSEGRRSAPIILPRGANIAGAGAAIGVVGGAVESTRIAAGVQNSLNQVQAQQHDTSANIKLLTDSVYQLAQRTGYSPKEIAGGYGQVERATNYVTGSGYRGQDAVDVMQNALQFSRVTHTSLEESIQAITTTSHDYRIKIQDATALLAAGSASVKGTMDDFANSLHSIEPAAQLAGIGPGEIIAALQQASQTGQTSQQSAPNLANLLKNLAAPGAAQSKRMGQMGINPEDISSNLSQRGLAGTLQVILDDVLKKQGPDGLVHLGYAYQNQLAQQYQEQDLSKLSPDAAALVQSPVFQKSELGGFQVRSLLTNPKKLKEVFGKSGVDLSDTDVPIMLDYLKKQQELHGPNSNIRSDSPDVQNMLGAFQGVAGGKDAGRMLMMLAGSPQMLDQFKGREAALGKQGTPSAFLDSFNQAMQSDTMKWKKLGSSLEALAGKMGEHMLPILGRVVDDLNGFVDFLDRNKVAMDALVGVVGTIAAAWGASKIVNMFSDLAPAFDLLKSGASGLGNLLSQRLPTQSLGGGGAATEDAGAVTSAGTKAAEEMGAAVTGAGTKAAGEMGASITGSGAKAAEELGAAIVGGTTKAAEAFTSAEVAGATKAGETMGAAITSAGAKAAEEMGGAITAAGGAAAAEMRSGMPIPVPGGGGGDRDPKGKGGGGSVVPGLGPLAEAFMAYQAGEEWRRYEQSHPDHNTMGGKFNPDDPRIKKAQQQLEGHARGGLIGYGSGTDKVADPFSQPLLHQPDMKRDSLLGMLPGGMPVGLRGGEGILTPEAVAKVGGKAGIDALNNPWSDPWKVATTFYGSFSKGVAKYSPWGKYLVASSQTLDSLAQEFDSTTKIHEGPGRGRHPSERSMERQYLEQLLAQGYSPQALGLTVGKRGGLQMPGGGYLSRGGGGGFPGFPGMGTGSSGGGLISALRGAGIDPAMYPLLQGFARTEGNNPSGVPTLGFTDSQAGSGLDEHARALAAQIRARQSVAGPFPANGSPQEQASWMATVVGQNGVASDWQGNAQPPRQAYVNSIVGGFGPKTWWSKGGVVGYGTGGVIGFAPGGVTPPPPSPGARGFAGIPDGRGGFIPGTGITPGSVAVRRGPTVMTDSGPQSNLLDANGHYWGSIGGSAGGDSWESFFNSPRGAKGANTSKLLQDLQKSGAGSRLLLSEMFGFSGGGVVGFDPGGVVPVNPVETPPAPGPIVPGQYVGVQQWQQKYGKIGPDHGPLPPGIESQAKGAGIAPTDHPDPVGPVKAGAPQRGAQVVSGPNPVFGPGAKPHTAKPAAPGVQPGDHPFPAYTPKGDEPGNFSTPGGDRNIFKNPSRQGGEDNKSKGFGVGGGILGAAEGAASMAANAFAPGSGQGAQMAFALANRAIGYGGQLLGILGEGLLETLLPNDSALGDPTKNLFGKVALGIAGAHPSPQNMAGMKSTSPLKPKDDLDAGAAQAKQVVPMVHLDHPTIHNHKDQQWDGLGSVVNKALAMAPSPGA